MFGNLALILSTRSRGRTALAALREPNAALRWIAAGALGALAVAIYFPPAASVFRFSPLAPAELAVAAGAGIAGVIWYEVWKVLRKR